MVSLIPVLVVEDDPHWQEGIQVLLQQSGRFQAVSIVDHYEDALSAFTQYQPQLVLLDWQIIGEKDGLDVGHKLLQLGLASHQIVLISAANPQSIPSHPFLYIPKNQISDQLLPLLDALFPA
ncbi:response regulator [Vampirovibrio chlorellavorus]|uniref:response regulator n=1 Tax=Vampirovibrio chlorellavorus TaxID=758823 RepID=UPI0026F3182C|nr:response regulator [Vampirovibrio chlorellavorus]